MERYTDQQASEGHANQMVAALKTLFDRSYDPYSEAASNAEESADFTGPADASQQ